MSDTVETILKDLDNGAESGSLKEALGVIERQNVRNHTLLERLWDFAKGKHKEPDGDENGPGPGDGDGDEQMLLKGNVCKGCGHKMAMGKKHPHFNMKPDADGYEAATKGARCTKCGGETMPLMGKGEDVMDEPEAVGMDDANKGISGEHIDAFMIEAIQTLKDWREYAPALTAAVEALKVKQDATEAALLEMGKGNDELHAKLNSIENGIGEGMSELQKGVEALSNRPFPALLGTQGSERTESPMDAAMTAAREASAPMDKGTSVVTPDNEAWLTQTELMDALNKGVLDLAMVENYKLTGSVNGQTTAMIRKQLGR